MKLSLPACFKKSSSGNVRIGLLRWRSNQSPGPGAVPLSTWQILICQVLPFPVKRNQRSPEKETYAMEMRQLYALIIVTGLLLTALHGGWNISDISVLFVVNLGN